MTQHDLVVIGAGPGGYVAAIRAAQLGMNVACIEKEPELGGTCLRVGCIPSKALLEASGLYQQAQHQFADIGIGVGKLSLDLPTMLSAKDTTVKTLTGGVAMLLKQNNVTRYEGHARFETPRQLVIEGNGTSTTIQTKQTLIATGSRPAFLPGVEPDGDRIGTSTEALSYARVPKHLVVIGAGYIGLELGAVWKRLGAEVTVLEYLDRILPGLDSEMAGEAHRIFRKQGLQFRLNCRVERVQASKKKCDVFCDTGDPISCDQVLLAVGRQPNTDGLNIEGIGVETEQRGFIRVNDRFETSVQGVFAIGDVIGGAMLAHKAEEEGIACVDQLCGCYGHVNYDAIPSVVYTDPEIASVGKTEDQLKDANVAYRKGSFPFAANGRARAIGHVTGKVKILADEATDRVLGVHIIGPHAGDLIAEAAVAIEFGASSEDIARCCHAHPTLAEAIKEAALAVDGRAIHFAS